MVIFFINGVLASGEDLQELFKRVYCFDERIIKVDKQRSVVDIITA